ncbi:MAG: sodium:proton antiporter [Gammaproteobacteria bacterium HGW-Gammaproteobacteria-6]|nr:MAG: sodium:proton antiporter [Gammaproteobacteria bacterium HGW-Gammaproteobacteria-6]
MKESCDCMGADDNRDCSDQLPLAPVQWSSLFSLPGMDCPSEERIIRLALSPFDEVKALHFDLAQRQLRLQHDGPVEPLTAKLVSLGMGATLLESHPVELEYLQPAALSDAEQAQTLRWLLGINAVMFVLEMAAGLIAQSAGLIADSLDMFADAAVYGLALYAVGRAVSLQMTAARIAGVVQAVLALGVLLEVLRRFVFGSEPQSLMMMAVALLALIANSICLLMIHKHRQGGVHMRASWIFSANDVLINVSVIVAGALVAWTGSNRPDLLIGTLVGLIVLNGARRILALKV